MVWLYHKKFSISILQGTILGKGRSKQRKNGLTMSLRELDHHSHGHWHTAETYEGKSWLGAQQPYDHSQSSWD